MGKMALAKTCTIKSSSGYLIMIEYLYSFIAGIASEKQNYLHFNYSLAVNDAVQIISTSTSL